MKLSPAVVAIARPAALTFLHTLLAGIVTVFAIAPSAGLPTVDTAKLEALLVTAVAAAVSVLWHSISAWLTAHSTGRNVELLSTIDQAVQNKLDYYAANPDVLQADLAARKAQLEDALTAPAAADVPQVAAQG